MALQIKVIWKAVPGVLGYNIKRTIGDAGIYERVNKSLVLGIFYIDTDVQTQYKYYYKVEAVYSNGTVVPIASSIETELDNKVAVTKSLLLFKNTEFGDSFSVGESDDPVSFAAVEDGHKSDAKQIFVKNLDSSRINSIVVEPIGTYKDWIMLWPTQSGLDDATPGDPISRIRDSSGTEYRTYLNSGETGSFWTKCNVPSSQINGIYLANNTKIRISGDK